MIRPIYCHKRNVVSFSYPKTSFSKQNFEKYTSSQQREEYTPIIQHDPSMYLHVVKDGVYHICNPQFNHTFCSLENLNRLSHQSDMLYHFTIRNLFLNCFDGNKSEGLKMKYITSTFYPEDVLEMNVDEYYEIHIKNKFRPLYLRPCSRLYDEYGERKKLIDLVHRMGKRRLLGLNDKHEKEVFEIERVRNIIPEDDESDFIDPPFYSIGIVYEDTKYNPTTVLMDNILVDLD
jgi:hypothetical protein